MPRFVLALAFGSLGFLSAACAPLRAQAREAPESVGETPPAGGDAKQAPRVAGGGGGKEPAVEGQEGEFPLAFNRELRYAWVYRRSPVGETRLKLSEVEAPAGSPLKKLFRSHSEYRYEREGLSLSGEHDAYFDRTWRPVRYQVHHRYSGLKDYRSRQDQEGEVRAGKIYYRVIHNGRVDQPVESELEVPPEAYLLLNQSMDHWAILAASVLRHPANCEAKAAYPDFLKVLELEFLYEKEEPLDLGKKEKPISRLFRFRAKEGDFKGSIWVDRSGRLLQYQQGDLRIYLAD